MTRRAKIFTRDVFKEEGIGGWEKEWMIDYITDDGVWVRYDVPVKCEAGWQEAKWRARQWIMCGIKTYGDEYKKMMIDLGWEGFLEGVRKER